MAPWSPLAALRLLPIQLPESSSPRSHNYSTISLLQSKSQLHLRVPSRISDCTIREPVGKQIGIALMTAVSGNMLELPTVLRTTLGYLMAFALITFACDADLVRLTPICFLVLEIQFGIVLVVKLIVESLHLVGATYSIILQRYVIRYTRPKPIIEGWLFATITHLSKPASPSNQAIRPLEDVGGTGTEVSRPQGSAQ